MKRQKAAAAESRDAKIKKERLSRKGKVTSEKIVFINF